MRSNVAAVNAERTHEGGMARIPKSSDQLLRRVATCMLFEDTFYEKGSEIAAGIADLARSVPVSELASVAVRAKNDFRLRHVPLFLLAQLDLRRAENPSLVSETLEAVVQRPDEMAELLAIIQKASGGKPLKKILSAQVKKGLARKFASFSEYQLSKWNRDSAIKLRDVMFLCHAKPKDATATRYTRAERKASVEYDLNPHEDLYRRVVTGELATADTWEVALSSGADKGEAWTRLLTDKKLGYTALLMNLRNMIEAKVDTGLIEAALLSGATKAKALPFKFFAAAKAVPSMAQAVSDAMVASLAEADRLSGSTYVVVDVSGSMDDPLSAKSQLTRMEAASALAVLVREVGARCRVFTFSTALAEVSNLRGIGLAQGIVKSQPHGGTHLRAALTTLLGIAPAPDRMIVITDEQSQDGTIPNLPEGTRGYIVNVAPYRPALEVSGRWSRISGFSERIVDFIRYDEQEIVTN